MEAIEILKEIQQREGISNAELSRRVEKTPQNLNNIISAGNPHITTYVDLIKGLGYRVVITKDEVNGYEIGGEGEYIDGKEEKRIWKEIEELKARLSEAEGIVK